jgi:autotransporter family porin
MAGGGAMRTLSPPKAGLAARLLSSMSLVALAATSAPDRAFAFCYVSVPTPSGVFALNDETCTAAAGTYNPTVQPDVSLPVLYTGFGFFASAGSVINSPNAVTINTTGASNAYGVWSDGAGATINLNGGTTVSTTGANSYSLYASQGGAISATAATTIATGGSFAHGVQADTGGAVILNGGSVAVTGTGSVGLFATGTGSTINATDVAVSTAGSGLPSTANAILAGPGAVITTTGGSASTTGTDAYVAGAFTTGGTGVATLNLSGTTITATGDGSGGLFANGTGSTVTATGVTITTHGNYDSVNGFHATGVTNQSYPGSPGGGLVTLTSSSILTTGTQATGVYTANGGTTRLTGDSITTSGANSNGVQADPGGSITLNGGSVSTTGLEAFGVGALGGGSVSISGTSVTTSGDASKGLLVLGPGSTLSASTLTVTTSGTINPADGDHAIAVFNGSGGGYAAGGTANLTNLTIRTSGAESDGVVTTASGNTTINGGSITTSGPNSLDLYATGSGSQIAANRVTLSTTGGPNSQTMVADQGAQITVIGGSASTTGDSSYAAGVTAGGSLSLNGTTITATGLGSGGLFVNGTGGVLDATNVSVRTRGGIDPSTGDHADGAFNGSYPGDPGGGTMTLTNLTIQTSGADAPGVATEDGGLTKISGGSITTSGDGATGLGVNGAGSSVEASDVNIMTQGGVNPATGDKADGAFNGPYLPNGLTSGGVLSLTNSTVATSGADGNGVVSSIGGTTTVSGGSVKTTGLEALGVIAEGGGALTISGTTVATTGDASKGLSALGTGSSLTASNLTVTTAGTTNSADGHSAFAVYNGSASGTSFLGGGIVTLTNVTAHTSGVASSGVVTANGGSTTILGSSVATLGQDAHALYATGAGSTVNLSGTNAFTTTGAGAIGVYAALGAVVAADGSSMTNVTTSGGVSPATGLGAYGVNADGAGSSVTLGAATITTSGPGAYGLLASDAAGSGTAGLITATGTLNVKTTNAGATAVGLVGNGATILATGGGTITSAGTAVSLSGGTNQTATFDNFTINNLSGDLVFADPSSSTVNFNSTTANAGTNPLFYATGAGTVATLNANGSTLTGTIQTGPGAISNVNLSNHTTWNLTGPSTVTNLNVTNSIIVFAPPGSGSGFKTLTVTNYVGSGAMITMNATLGGSTSGSDQIIVNGGKATGSTLLTINNFGGLGGATSGAGIPLVVATNGGTVAPGAFALANTPLVGGFRYMLQESNNDWYLVSTPAPTSGQVQSSINQVAKAQQTQIVTNRVLNSLLLGATQQISCTSCAGGFASIGSFAAGAEGRWGLSDELTLIGGLSYNQWYASGISVENAPTVAGSLIYDLWKWGESRPFFQVGGALTPYEDVYYTRYYANGLTTAVGNASAIDRDLSLFGRAGWIDRFSPIDEAAVYGDLGRDWLQTGGYTEMTSFLNPFPATVRNGLDTLNVAHLGGQWTHLFNGNIEANVTAAVAYGFGAGDSAQTSVLDFGPIAPSAIANTTWMEWGARLGYRFNNRVVIDAFVVGTAFGQIGTTVHGGVGLRYEF